jgi:hypothetical protein
MLQRSQTTSRPNPTRRKIKRKSRDDTGPRFLIGLDLGQARDYTAMVIVERMLPSLSDEQIEYHVRHLERYELGTPYTEIVEDMTDLLSDRDFAGKTSLIVDGTGVGVPVIEMFREAGLSPLPIWITGGDAVSRKGRILRVPKRDLVSVLQVLFQSRRLKVSRAIDLGSVLVEELMNFRVKITANANDTYGAWREGTHDDLVLALSLACWTGERMLKQPRTSMHIEDVRRTRQ